MADNVIDLDAYRNPTAEVLYTLRQLFPSHVAEFTLAVMQFYFDETSVLLAEGDYGEALEFLAVLREQLIASLVAMEDEVLEKIAEAY